LPQVSDDLRPLKNENSLTAINDSMNINILQRAGRACEKRMRRLRRSLTDVLMG